MSGYSSCREAQCEAVHIKLAAQKTESERSGIELVATISIVDLLKARSAAQEIHFLESRKTLEQSYGNLKKCSRRL